MENAYAQALWAMITGKGLPAGRQGIEPKKAVDSLYEHLKLRGREVLMPKIAKAFERLSAREDQKNTVTLSIAHEKDARKAKAAIKELLAKFDVAADDVKTQIDETLIGGWRLEGKEMLADASFKKYLLEMYNRATA